MPYYERREVVRRVVAFLRMEVCAPLAAARTVQLRTPTSPSPINRRCMRYRSPYTAMRQRTDDTPSCQSTKPVAQGMILSL